MVSMLAISVLLMVGLTAFGLFLIVLKVQGGLWIFCLALVIVVSIMNDWTSDKRVAERARQARRRAKPLAPKPIVQRVIREGNYTSAGVGSELKNKRRRSRNETPSNTPRKVLVMLQNDLSQALRLYEGVANRNPDKSSDWVWERVASDLERDRR
jgi:hypothetical protein